MAITVTSFDAALKVRYTPERLRFMGYRNNPLLAMLPKSETLSGKYVVVPVWHGAGGGRSATFSNATGNQADHGSVDFQLTRTKNYGIHYLDADALAASRGEASAFLEARMVMMDETVYNLTRDIANDLYRDGSGKRGSVGSISTTVLTLADRNDVVHFEVGMELVGAADATSALRDSGNSATITAIDRDAGTLTSGSNWTTQISGLTTGDLLFVEGDYVSASDRNKASGLDAWLPATAPSATAFFSVDRTADVQRLGGIRYDGSSSSVHEAIIDAGTIAFEAGAQPDFVFMNPLHKAEVVKSLQQQARYEPVLSSDGRVGFQSVVVETGAGPVRVVADPNCPKGVAYMLQMDTWKLYSLGAVPHLADEDGLSILRSSDADQYEVRFRSWAQLGCSAPGRNTRIALAT